MRVLKNKTFKRDTLRYLSGLQLMAVIIRPVAALACEGTDGEIPAGAGAAASVVRRHSAGYSGSVGHGGTSPSGP